EDDGGHGREIVDIDFDEIDPAVPGRKLLQIDRRGDSDRKADQEADQQRVERADDRARQPGKFREAAVGVEEQARVEGPGNDALPGEFVEPADLLVADAAAALGNVAADLALGELVERIGNRQRYAHRTPD